MSAQTSSFESFFEEQWRPLVAAITWTDNRIDAEDVAQEALAIACSRWETVRRHPRPDAWLFLTAYRLARREQRRQDKYRELDISFAPLPDDDHSRVESRIRIAETFRSLRERQRKAVILRHYLGLSTSETASLLRCREGTVKSLLGRARTTLRDAIRAAEEEIP